MIRMQIQLTEEQLDKVRRAAQQEETSVSDVVRKAVDALTAPGPSPAELRRRALEAAGRFASGQSDVASNHDRHLAVAFHPRSGRARRPAPVKRRRT
jgi:hypothetical protein